MELHSNRLSFYQTSWPAGKVTKNFKAYTAWKHRLILVLIACFSAAHYFTAHTALSSEYNVSSSLLEYLSICKSALIKFDSNTCEDMIFFSCFGLSFQLFSIFIAWILAGCWKDHMTRAMSKVIEYNVDKNSVEKCVAMCKQKSKIFL